MNPSPAERMQLALKLAAQILPKLSWRRLTDAEVPRELQSYNARAFEGSGEASCTCASFSIEAQGFPAGTRGYDGAIIVGNPPLVLHLTRELAQRAVELAEATQPRA